MNKRLYSLLLSACMLLTAGAHAQCTGGRYVDQVFSGYTMNTVVYSTPYNLSMDIYQPTGDTYAERPLIILAHGGSFIGGTRTQDVTVDSLCVRFAKRGYVTASIDYRLGNLFSMVSDSSEAIATVIRAISDGKAAIRYFMKDRVTANTYKVDTNNIFVGGNSAGAVLYMHVGYLDGIADCPPYIATAMAANGGFEGNSGNDGYITRVRGVVNLAGALNLPSFVKAFAKPVVSAQGTADVTVPYNCAYPLTGTVHVNLCGLGSLEPVFTSKGVYHMSKVFTGDAHVPWDADPAKFKSVDSLVRDFLFSVVCTNVASVNEVNTATEVNLYPNPATDMVKISASAAVASITVCDQTGRTVYAADVKKDSYELNTSHFAKGLYFVKVTFDNSAQNTPMVKRLLVE